MVVLIVGLTTGLCAQNQVFTLLAEHNLSQAVSVNEGVLKVLEVDESKMGKSQKFILKRLINGNIMIASAEHPNMCFKHTGTSVELSRIGATTTDFEWKIEYIADDQYMFKHATLTDQCLAVNEANGLTVMPILHSRKRPHRGCCRFVLVPEDNPF